MYKNVSFCKNSPLFFYFLNLSHLANRQPMFSFLLQFVLFIMPPTGFIYYFCSNFHYKQVKSWKKQKYITLICALPLLLIY